MMHYEDTIITIVDGNKTPLKEYESEKINKGRKSKVFLPFDSEYQFYIKNNNDTRIKIDVEIDGSLITNDGFVIGAYQTTYLERFLNSKEKFKFVKANNEAVSDPTSVENGIVKVRIYKEKKYCPTITSIFPPQPVWIHHHNHFLNYPVGVRGFSDTNTVMYGSNISALNSPGINVRESDYSSNLGLIGEAGATVGGSISNQSFTTTSWNGDNGVDTYFTFILKGVSSQDKAEKLSQFLKLKQELGL